MRCHLVAQLRLLSAWFRNLLQINNANRRQVMSAWKSPSATATVHLRTGFYRLICLCATKSTRVSGNSWLNRTVYTELLWHPLAARTIYCKMVLSLKTFCDIHVHLKSLWRVMALERMAMVYLTNTGRETFCLSSAPWMCQCSPDFISQTACRYKQLSVSRFGISSTDL